ncbi:MAG: ribosome recycling factor [Ectothiorhodospiraceae bacterium]|nr:ribosome recycling factor [Chromatiales bacterium]MCP5156914.1 ribosome recycling factor [Ectothiorhodospiraceae bacterium]
MVEDIKKDARERMSKSVEALRHELTKLRTGRAHTSLLDHVKVSYYGSDVPLNQVASVSVGDARTLLVQPWERKIVPDVEKAILNSDLGLNPVSAGEVIRVPLPPLTEERRREMTRVVRGEAEAARVAIRNIRRDANQHLKQLIKDEHLAKDAEKRAEDEIQKLTDEFIAQVDQVLKEKEADLLEV